VREGRRGGSRRVSGCAGTRHGAIEAARRVFLVAIHTPGGVATECRSVILGADAIRIPRTGLQSAAVMKCGV